MNIRTLITGIGLFFIAQGLSWFQTNGQFLNVWVKNNPFWVALVFGAPVGMAYIYGTTYIVEAFGGQLWPSRLIGFATGIFAFTILSYAFMGEGINLKTGVILSLATIIVVLQIFWK
tara:strand:+ start:354 stop:704 length:351 start_codon:yes stop_codon:yes gene_type:complete